jgi:phytanoyl-CoA hydroxylase
MFRQLVSATLRNSVGRTCVGAWCASTAPREDPWFDQATADEQITRHLEHMQVSEPEAQYLRDWVQHGCFVVRNAVPISDIDNMVALVDGLATLRRPITGLTLLAVRESPDSDAINISHRDFIKRYSSDDRRRMLSQSCWRIHGFHRYHRNPRRIFRNREMARIASMIFQRNAIPSTTITFSRGSAQALHQDMAVFHIKPRNFLIGAWLACEDIAPDSGPLVYCPGSHRSEWFTEFNDYPQTNLRTGDSSVSLRYHDWVDQESRRYRRKTFLAKKGDALFWHPMLFHGGDAIERANASRKSLVIHYVVRGADRAWAVKGPFNW